MPPSLSPSLQTTLSIFQTLQTVEALQELPIESLASLLIYLMCEKNSSTIEVATSKEGRTTIVNFILGPEARGRVIGKNGHTIRAVRSICRSIERSRGLDVMLEILDQEGSSNES